MEDSRGIFLVLVRMTSKSGNVCQFDLISVDQDFLRCFDKMLQIRLQVSLLDELHRACSSVVFTRQKTRYVPDLSP